MCGSSRDVRVGFRCIRPIHNSLELFFLVEEYITYHIKGDDIFERDLSSFVFLDENTIYGDRAGTCGKTKHEWM